jgi:hypothetical protein
MFKRISRWSIPVLLSSLLIVLTLTLTASAAELTLIPRASTWKYLDNGSNQGSGWRGVDFNDSSWSSGQAQFGYGDGDETTIINYGSNPDRKYVTTYFRRSFQANNISSFQAVVLRLLRDDGAVVYLNGTEIWRNNMPSGSISSSSYASSCLGGSDESEFYETSIDPSLLLDGTNVIAVELHQCNRTSSDLSFDLELVASIKDVTGNSLIATGASWKYLDNGSDQGTNWYQVNHNDTNWKVGNAQLGYGDGDEMTKVGFGNDANYKYVTTYFRHAFDVIDKTTYQSLTLKVLRDDGAVVYLNGTEIWRNNMPSGSIDYLTLATYAIAGEDETTFSQINIDSSLLLNGRNLIAVEIHQSSYNSSDISFDLELTGTTLVNNDPVIAAAGDVACSGCRHMETSNLLLQINPNAVFALGDLQYEYGEYENFLRYYDPSWGRVKGITYPAVGNHEYGTAGAEGYFDYFNGIGNFSGPAGDRDKGYYSFDIGSWHIIVLNSNCAQVGGCHAGSPQEKWLREDLAAHSNACTLAFWHHPRFSSGQGHGNNETYKAFWQALYEYEADVVLVGHEHVYERFAPQTPSGVSDPDRGIRQFTVGTGGRAFHSFGTILPTSEVRNRTSHGVLKMALRPKSYDWEFIPIAGQTFKDSGTSACVCTTQQ